MPQQLLIEPPDDTRSRGAVLQLVAEMERQPRFPDRDPGSKYLHVDPADNFER